MKISVELGKKSKTKKVINYYKGIDDLPIWNFDILCKGEERDYQYLLKDIEDEFPEDIDKEELWITIYDEYLKTYGLGEDYKEYCRLIRKASQAYHKVYFKNQPHQITFGEIFTAQAEQLIRNIEGGDLSVTCASLTKYMGIRINPMKTSVREFNSYIEIAKRESEKNG
jgi:hypothetical protein